MHKLMSFHKMVKYLYIYIVVQKVLNVLTFFET